MQATKNNQTNPQTTVDEKILKGALGALEEATGATAHILEWQPKLTGGLADAIMEVVKDNNKVRYLVEIKPTFPATALGHIVAQLRKFDKPAIIITRHITAPMAERLKRQNIAFLDTAGNTYINTPKLYVYVTGRKPEKTEDQAKKFRAFRATGLKVIFALLCIPDLVRANYRDIAKAADVALGTVGWVMYDLKRLNYIVERGKLERKLLNKRKLFDAWVTAYGQELRPKLYLGRFRGPKVDWWKNMNWRGVNAYLGGETAAAELTGYLKPETATIYITGDVDPLLLYHRLKRDPNGDVEMIKTFWHFDYEWNYPHLAPPLLIYAELMRTAEDRNIETGKLIYDQYLARLVGED
ncbi:MAG: hypothetical protein MN733_35245 [Nitrososphaera sp.]|nr:hypothetical protein [Nitrososphaera sp.]